MTLQEKLDNHKAEFLKKAPADALAVMKRAADDLAGSGILDGVLKKGVKAPLFDLPDEKGQMTASQKLLEKGPLVVSFYRGVW